MYSESTWKHNSCLLKAYSTLNVPPTFFLKPTQDRTEQNPDDAGSMGGLGFYFTEQVKMENLQPLSQLPMTNESLYYRCNLVITYSLNVDPLAF